MSAQVPSDVAKGRDLSTYDYGGVYGTRINVDRITDLAGLRQFVWSHWSHKRRGYVVYVFQGTDAGNKNYFCIEPAGDGWHIAWFEQHYQAQPGYSPPPPKSHPDIVTIERRDGALIFFDARHHIVTSL